MVFFIALLGLLFEKSGILSAMTAHAVFDAILLLSMVEKRDVNENTGLFL
jgi:membrane protease YdiL (CAAX protease family)